MYTRAIISDVHSNLEALYAVLTHIRSIHPDSIYFLGDSVGYGPNPNECTELLREIADRFVAGNHDWAATGLINISYFNPYAQIAIEWTQSMLTYENRVYLQERPLTYIIDEPDLFLVHGSPLEPENWHYIVSEPDALEAFPQFSQTICFVGHSHVPFILELQKNGRIKWHFRNAEIKRNSRYIVNAGSVGQPRDGNPQASFVILVDNMISIKRVPYDIVLTQKKMKKAGLPGFLIERLSAGR